MRWIPCDRQVGQAVGSVQSMRSVLFSSAERGQSRRGRGRGGRRAEELSWPLPSRREGRGRAMEVVAEAGGQQPWDQFKEEVEIMEEEHGGGADAVEELLTREIKRRLAHDHGSSNGNGNGNGAHHANGGEEEEEDHGSGGDDEDHANGGGGEEAVEEQQQQHKSIFLDPAKVPDIITEVSARYLVTGTIRSSAEKEDANGTSTPKGKGLEAHENDNGEINHGPRNGKLENGSHSNGSHQVPNDGEPKMECMFEINKTEIYPAEVDKDENTAEAQPKVEEYDLEKILDQQETHDLFCPNCKSCITRRVILKKRKRKVRTTPTEEPSKRPNIEGAVPPVTLPDRVEEQSPDVFRCLSCFSFFIPTGCSFNIFRIFGRRGLDGQPDVLPPPASEDMPPRSENCTSWLLSCFQTGDSPNQPHSADPTTVPLLSGTQSSDNTNTITESQSSTSYVYHSEGTVVKPEHPTVESPSANQTDPADSPRIPPLPGIATPSGATTTTTETDESYVQHSHVTQQLTVDSSSQHQKTTTTVEDNETTTTVTSEKNTTSSKTTTGAPSASSQTSSSTEYFKQDVTEVVTGKMPSGGAIMHQTHHLIGDKDAHGTTENGSFPSYAIHTPDFKVDSPTGTNIVPGFIPRGDMPTSPNPQPADHVVVPVFGGVNQVAPRPQQRDDWDILKAIVYGGLVESVTSLSVVSAAASSGTKTLDIFILGIANLIGGLPLIFHNIADLRDIRDVDGNNEQVGHYWLQLGRRSKARLHMVMALISYMVFGLLPPVLYGLSFHESNDRENKMMTVAGASLACIALLALGKAHVHTRTYFKTLMYYLTIAVSSSGLSYGAGVLITRLLVQYGIIEQGGSAAPAPPGLSSPFAYGAGAESSAWASF